MTTRRPLALVTGASRGIGYALAEQLIDRGYDVVVTAEDTEIDFAAATLRRSYAQVGSIRADLRTDDGVQRLYEFACQDGRPLEVVALNAGVGRGGAAFTETGLDEDFDLIALNVRSTVHLAKLVLPDMVERNAGKLLFTSSIAAMMPGANMALYNASKSFVQSFAEALREELRSTGITVTALMPGPTDTDFFRRAKMLDTPMGRGPKEDPVLIARQGIDALLHDKRKVIAGSVPTKVAGLISRVLPDSIKAKGSKLMASVPGASSR
ncbi:SDR family NAD(P)-dependent oxidoreductase [Nocardia ignorata]|uniref:SDR family NAD(P)-dependent oxidoreductase n=1 Tax=Nocardia ignorata TaxID=145285 RepID=UPI00362BAFAA